MLAELRNLNKTHHKEKTLSNKNHKSNSVYAKIKPVLVQINSMSKVLQLWEKKNSFYLMKSQKKHLKILFFKKYIYIYRLISDLFCIKSMIICALNFTIKTAKTCKNSYF